MGILLVLLVLATILGAALYLSHLAEGQRRESLHALAAELGWQFDPREDDRHHRRHGHFSSFGKGSRRRAFNTLRGTLDLARCPCRVTMGDYRYTLPQGKSSRTYRMSYLIAELPFGSVPALAVRPEGLLHQVAAAFGFDDIDFESAEFSDRFHVRSRDKRFAFDVFHPRMMEFFLAAEPPQLEIAADECCLVEGKRRWQADLFRERLAWVKEFLDLWPEHLRSRLPPVARLRLEDVP